MHIDAHCDVESVYRNNNQVPEKSLSLKVTVASEPFKRFRQESLVAACRAAAGNPPHACEEHKKLVRSYLLLTRTTILLTGNSKYNKSLRTMGSIVVVRLTLHRATIFASFQPCTKTKSPVDK